MTEQTPEERVHQILDNMFKQTVCMDDSDHNLEVPIKVLDQSKQAIMEEIQKARVDAQSNRILDWMVEQAYRESTYMADGGEAKVFDVSEVVQKGKP